MRSWPRPLAAPAFSIGCRGVWRGYVGERRVRRLLARHGIEAAHDLLLPRTDRPGWTRVDHLAKVAGRIVVIETKNLSGCIFGRERDSSWTQLHGKWRRSINNPLHQNYGHVTAVRALAGSGVAVEGVVVLVGTARFPDGLPLGCCDLEIFGQRLRRPFPADAACGARSRLDAAWEAVLRAASMRQLDRWRHVRDLERPSAATRVARSASALPPLLVSWRPFSSVRGAAQGFRSLNGRGRVPGDTRNVDRFASGGGRDACARDARFPVVRRATEGTDGSEAAGIREVFGEAVQGRAATQN